MDVFLVCVVLQPTQKQKHDDGAVPMIVVQPQAVMAKDEQQAAMKIFKSVPDEFAGNVDRLEVRVLPFRAITRA